MYGVVVVVVLGASSMIVLMVVVEYTTRVVTLCGCVSFCGGVYVIIFNAIERYVSCVMVVVWVCLLYTSPSPRDS